MKSNLWISWMRKMEFSSFNGFLQVLRAALLIFAALNLEHASADPLEEFDGLRGFWLRSATVEAFVAIEPVFRLAGVRRPGAPSLMADKSRSQQGLRLAFMEPDQIASSFDVSKQRAEVLERTPLRARVSLNEAMALKYSVDITLDESTAAIKLEYSLKNVGMDQRRVACWSVIALPPEGIILAPFGDSPKSRRRLVVPSWTRWPQPNMEFGKVALGVGATGAKAGPYKIGVRSEAGWIAFVRGRDAIISFSPFQANAEYPEDGANMTFFEGGAGRSAWREIEHVGPLQDLRPGEEIKLSETLVLVQIPASVLVQSDALREELGKHVN